MVFRRRYPGCLQREDWGEEGPWGQEEEGPRAPGARGRRDLGARRRRGPWGQEEEGPQGGRRWLP